MSDNNNQDVEVEAPGGFKFKAVGSNVIPLLTLLMVALLLYGGYRHDADAHDNNTQVVQVIKEQTKVQWEMVNAQRESNCLARLDPKNRRESDIEFCRNLGRGR